MILPVAATFEERVTGRKVNGRVSLTTLPDIQSQQRWQHAEDALDRDWNWLQIWLPCRANPGRFECYSAVIQTELHGLMALDLRGRKVGPGRGLIVDFLATNSQDRIPGQGFKYIDVVLMAVAVARSLELGMEGRIWLESLPDPRTLKFYESIGMTRLRQKSSEGYDIFVFEIGRAREFLRTAIDEKWVRITNRE